eukprot:scaffold87461_cov42-Phaeocystis_antarctica.AAC.1
MKPPRARAATHLYISSTRRCAPGLGLGLGLGFDLEVRAGGLALPNDLRCFRLARQRALSRVGLRVGVRVGVEVRSATRPYYLHLLLTTYYLPVGLCGQLATTSFVDGRSSAARSAGSKRGVPPD